MTEYKNRQKWDYGTWPELDRRVIDLQDLILTSPPGIQTNLMVFTVASQAAGCRHCQAHGSFGLSTTGVDTARIRELWSFESSELFDAREKAALRFALAAGQVPSGVGPEHHADIRAHYSDEEARTLLAVVALSGFTNRFNDALATVTDALTFTWATENLGAVGWEPGRHVGADHERRPDPVLEATP